MGMDEVSLGGMSSGGCFVASIRWGSVEDEVAAMFGSECRRCACRSAIRGARLRWRWHTNLRGLEWG